MHASDRLREVFGLDLRALGVYRMALGAIVLVDVLRRCVDLEAHYLDAGAVPRALILAENAPPLLQQLFFASGHPAWTGLLLGLLAVAAMALAAGRFTRTATIVCWLLFSALMARDPFVTNFGDRILRLILFWSMFLPLGARYALDRRPATRTTNGVVATPATAAYMIQLVAVYFFGALLKSDPVWLNGEALQYALHFDQATTAIGAWLTGYPGAMTALTYATLAIEGVLVLAVFSPFANAACRSIVIVAIYAFHLGLALTITLGHFPLVCVIAWIPLLPAAVWDAWGLARSDERPSAEAPAARRAVDGVVVAALALVLAVNFESLWTSANAYGRTPIARLARPVGLDQRWSMFAPKPMRIDGWMVVSGQRADGRLVDAWQGGGPARWTKPEDPAGRYPNYRWLGFMVKLAVDRDRSRQKEYFADWLCRRGRAHADAQPDLEFVSIDFVQELTLPDGEEAAPIPIKLIRHRCRPGPESEA